MVDEKKDLSALEDESGMSTNELSEIRDHIENVVKENRISFDDSQISLQGVKRGVLLPVLVNALVALTIIAVVIIFSFVSRRGEQELQATEAQYVSIEGRLIRELRQEAKQKISLKQQEIEEIKVKIHQLELQQQEIDEIFNVRLREKEEELKKQYEQEIENERLRLLTLGIIDSEIEARIKIFEAERKAFYDRQLSDFREQLEEEKNRLVSDIDTLREEYNEQLIRLEAEQRQITEEYEQRESDLRIRLEQKTLVMEQLRTEAVEDLEEAQRELKRLAQSEEEATVIENQINGMVDDIQEAQRQGNTAYTLEKVKALQEYLNQDRVRLSNRISGRIRTEIYLLNHLETMLKQQLDAEAGDELSLTAELEILGKIRSLTKLAEEVGDEQERLELYRKIVRLLPDVSIAADALTESGIGEVEELARAEQEAALAEAQETYQKELEEALADQLSRIFEDETLAIKANATAEAQHLTNLLEASEEQVEQLESDLNEKSRWLDELAAEAGVDSDELDVRISGLINSEKRIQAVQTAYENYLERNDAVQTENPEEAITASRLELNKFLRSEAMRSYFAELADRVNALYSATQSAGSSAALDDAAEIINSIANQPTLETKRNLLKYDVSDLDDDDPLKAMLLAIDEVFAGVE